MTGISGLYKNTKGAIEHKIETEALIRMENDVPVLVDELSRYIANLEMQAKAIKNLQDEVKTKLLEEMEKHGIIKIDTEDLTITYVASTTRETFDGKSFKNDFPDLYDEYVKIGNVSPSVRLKLKGEK